MKTYAIKNNCFPGREPLGYLFHYENQGKFFIELSDSATQEETPLILSDFLARQKHTINAYWSKIWVQQRIVPSDRQNLGQILRAHKMTEYDEFKLLYLTQGRCAQDDCFISAIKENELPEEIRNRNSFKVSDVLPCQNHKILVFFRNRRSCLFDVSGERSLDRFFSPVLNSVELFNQVEVETGGYGIRWNDDTVIDADELYGKGEFIPLDEDFLSQYVVQRTMNAAQAAEVLGCSRQYINDLVKKGHLHPLKSESKNTLFLKRDIEERLW